MSVKCTGFEWNAFYSDNSVWRPGYWHDDEYIEVNGVEFDENALGANALDSLPESASVKVSGGVIFDGDNNSKDLCSVESALRKWLKDRNSVTMIVTAPKAKADDVREAIKAAGGKVEQ